MKQRKTVRHRKAKFKPVTGKQKRANADWERQQLQEKLDPEELPQVPTKRPW